MTPELQAFVDFFKNEAQLRSAIEALLSRQDDCSGVRQLHGMDEVGKDIIFYAPVGLGRLSLNACVIKLTKITGSVSDARSGARNVLIQCEQALDTPIINSQGKEEWVGLVLVMSPDELSATAMQSISGQFKGRSSQIEFICGNDLLELFKSRWPGFIFFQPDLLSAHLDSLGKQLECDQNIQRLGIAHGLSTVTQSRKVYVEPILSQIRGQLSRETDLPDSSFFTKIEQMNIDPIANMIEQVIKSLRLAAYLPASYKDGIEDTIKQLDRWPSRFEGEWFVVYNRARVEAQVARKDPPRSVPVPDTLIRAFLNSPEFQHVTTVYRELDNQIAQANSSVHEDNDRTDILDSSAFAMYGCLLQSTGDCFPYIDFRNKDLIQWSPDEALSANRNLLITAAAGYGKTSFCRNHFLEDLERFKAGESTILPLYFAAHTIKADDTQTFEDVFIRPEVRTKLEREPHLSVRIYLDGLDEIESTALRERILTLAKQACTGQNSRTRCIATAREHIGGFATIWLPRLTISPLSDDGLRNLVTAWLDGDFELIKAFYSELVTSDSLVPVLRVPLLATLTVLVFRNLHRLPENRLRLYQMFIDLLLGGWNLAKGLQRSSQYSSTAKQSILTRLAGLMHAAREKECGIARIKFAFTQVAPAFVPELNAVVSELVEDGLLLPTGRATYIFPHLSFQEYLAAKDAIDPARFEEKRIVQNFLNGDDWFKEVAIFIISMTTNAPRMREWIIDLAKPTASAIGLSDGERRAGDLISKIREIFPESRVVLGHT